MKALDVALQKWRMARVAPFVPKGSRILDVGCADGRLGREIPGWSAYTGVDPLVWEPWQAPGGAFLQGHFPEVLPAGERWDVVTALAVFEHLDEAQRGPFARACAGALRPGGVALLTVPSRWVDPILDVLMAVRILDGMETESHHAVTAEDVTSAFTSAGFRVEVSQRFQLGLNHLFVFCLDG